MSISTVPAVTQAITAQFQAAIPGRKIVFGQPLNNLGQRFMVVGWSEQGPGVSVGQSAAVASLQQQYEDYDIACGIVSWAGGGDLLTVMQQVYDDFDAVTASLLSNPYPGDCMLATVTDHTFAVIRPSNKVQADLAFTVHVQASRS